MTPNSRTTLENSYHIGIPRKRRENMHNTRLKASGRAYAVTWFAMTVVIHLKPPFALFFLKVCASVPGGSDDALVAGPSEPIMCMWRV